MKTEVRRGRKFVEYIDDSLPVGTFVQEIGAHDVSYQDDNSVWQPIDESWETDGQDGFSFRAQRMNHKVRFDSIGAWRWYPRRNVETEYIIINRPKCWLTRTNRWGNLLVNGISREGRDITLTSLRNVTRVIHSRWNGIKTDWILENADAPTRFQQQIGLVGLTEVDGWLYGADGEQVARLTPTIAIDAEGNELPTSTSYQNGILEFQADVTGAVYPVVIDPDYAGDTGDGYIISSTAAAWATARSTSSEFKTYASAPLKAMFIGNSVVTSDGKHTLNRSYLKFDTSSIPDTDTVTQVNLKMTANAKSTDGTASPANFDIVIQKQNWASLDLTNATDRETAYDATLTATSDDNIWENTANISVNTAYTSGNLDTTYVNKTGVTTYSLIGDYDLSNTEVTVMGTATTRFFYVRVWTAEHATEAYRPVLIVAYSDSSGQNLTLTCAAGSYSLTGTNADFEVKRNYVLNAVYPDMIVSGAEYSAANGTYVETGTYNGRPRYIHESNADYVIVWDSPLSWWIIYDEVDVTFGYYTVGDAATPDLGSSWTNGLTETPSALTVTAANAYKLTGTDATLTVQRNYTLVCEPGSYSLTGTDITFGNSKAYSLTCEAGAYTLTGSSVSFVIQRNYSLACETGSYSLTGTDVTLTYTQGAQNLTLTCEAGSYSLTGSDVTLDPTFHYSLTLEAGSYTLTGTDVTLTKTTGAQSYTLSLEAGTYSLTGTNAGLTSARTIALASGSYALTGTNASLFKGLVLPCASGSYALTGSDASLTSHRIFALGMGSYVLVGTACGLFILSPTPTCRTATIEFENRTFAIPHENRTLEVTCH